MKKVAKIVLWSVVGLIALVLVGFLLSPLWLGQTAGMVANAVVPKITGTEFNVDKIRINPYTGTLRVEKLNLANPKGYDAEDAAKIDLLYVKVAPLSVFSSVITVNNITIENPYVSYLDANGKNNFDQILENVNSGKKEEKKEEPKPEAKEDDGEGKKVVIEKLSITGIRVRYGMLTLPIPPLVLSNIGASKGGVSLENAGLEVWESIKSAFTSTGGAIGGAAKSLGSGAANLLKGVTGGDADKSVAEGAKKATEAVDAGAKKAAESAKKATEALGNLFK